MIQATFGNGVVASPTFDDVTALLTKAEAGVGGGAALLNQTYTYFETGNLKLRQDNNLGLNESFAYDADLRLTCTALSANCNTPTVAIVYDGGAAGPGNITSQTGVGTYTYPAAGQPRPHAVTSLTGTLNGITNPAFSYDANGNMTARASSSTNITWSSYNYPVSISGSDATGSEEVQFSYGPDRQRWEQIYSLSSTNEKTYYVGGLMDLVIKTGSANDYRHYIYAGGNPVAVYSRTGAGGITMRYLLEDHEGSVSAVASNSGASDVDESFSSFGQRRNPTTWSGAPSTSDLNTIAGISRQGYTFQTWLGQSMGLNHMNGRVEDAILGRMISPDPHITDPTNAQSYNRYSYVINNPLVLIDLTGFESRHCTGSMIENCNVPGSDPNSGASGIFGNTLGWGSNGIANVTSSLFGAVGGGSFEFGGGFDVGPTSSDGSGLSFDNDGNPIGSYSMSYSQVWVPSFASTPTFNPFPPGDDFPQPPLPGIVVTASRPSALKNFLCHNSSESGLQSLLGYTGMAGTASDTTKPIVAIGATAASIARNAQGEAILGSELAQGLGIIGRAGGASAMLGLSIDALNGDGQSFFYDLIDYGAYTGLSYAGGASAIETAGGSVGVAGFAALNYYMLGGSKGIVQSNYCQ